MKKLITSIALLIFFFLASAYYKSQGEERTQEEIKQEINDKIETLKSIINEVE